MASVCGQSSKKFCLRSPFEEIAINRHFSSFKNLEKHLEQEASRSFFYLFSHLLFCYLHLLFSNDIDLLWSQDGSNVYLNLFDFSKKIQIYVEANHVDDYHACMHGLIHDGRFRACQSCL
jgi:hypothetical protein